MKKNILLTFLLFPLLLSCIQEPKEILLAAQQAETALQPLNGKTILQPYNTPDGTLALPFAGDMSVQIPMNVISSLSDDGESISLKLKNKRGFTFPKEDPATAPTDGPAISVVFRDKDNIGLLLGDLTCRIENKKAICELPYLLPSHKLHIDINLREGYTATLRDKPDTDIHSRIDFTLPTIFIIEGHGQKDSLTIQLFHNTRLPSVNILTDGCKEILSKEEYLKAEIYVKDNPLSPTRGLEDLTPTPAKIRGRGNSTWLEAKKPYKFKFDKKTPLLGMPAGKQWVLLANSIDNTQLRNVTGFALSEELGLEWTPRYRFVNLFINNRYRGIYQLTEQIKAGKDRVNIPDEGYLLEIDAATKIDTDDIHFKTDHFQYVVIKDPDTQYGSQTYETIKKDFNHIEKTLFSDDWLDEQTGYKTLIDIESFAKWYVIHELSGHDDHAFHTSCYMYKSPDDKLKAGPVWDFDQSFGYFHTANYRLSIRQTSWFQRLFKDPAFIQEVSIQLEACKKAMPRLFDLLDTTHENIDMAVIENNILWSDLTSPYAYESVRHSMTYNRENLKTYLQERIELIENSLQ